MGSGLVGSGSRLFTVTPPPQMGHAVGDFPVDMSVLPAEFVEEYSRPSREYDCSSAREARGGSMFWGRFWSLLLKAGVERVRWTRSPLHHFLPYRWASEEAFETLHDLADNVYSKASLVFEDGTTEKTYHWWTERLWPMHEGDNKDVVTFPWVVHEACEPPVPTTGDVAEFLDWDGSRIVALPPFVDRPDRIMALGPNPFAILHPDPRVVTESFVARWRGSKVGREIAERGEPDLVFDDWPNAENLRYRWVEADEPPGIWMREEYWFPPGADYVTNRPLDPSRYFGEAEPRLPPTSRYPEKGKPKDAN